MAESFAAYFRPWALALPQVAVDTRADGTLHARGWAVRWRWLPEGALEFRATNRMSNDRWQTLFPDGTSQQESTPPEMYADDDVEARRAYRQAWKAYKAALDERDMHPRATTDAPKKWDSENQLLWSLDADSSWKIETLPPRPEI
ncbi:hypothetical protein GCM10009555_088800 [Acrocarpospora macrocephala]|uniref:Uncharacterized protein n=1 Tax=Acrocarpospora macrocephala TaxID=150177 RepID=A0A5M3X5G8_9ACTN|nr:hypothetical protein Amac_076900 [Acrocarpospora macrocephala]